MSFVDEIIARMILATDAKNQQEMIEIAGLSAGLPSVWKKRKKVSDSGIAKVAEMANVSFSWLKTGKGEMRGGKLNLVEPMLKHKMIGSSEAKEHQDAYGPIDSDTLAKTIERTDYILASLDKKLSPAQKATFVSTLYEMAMEQGESALDDASITRLIRLVG